MIGYIWSLGTLGIQILHNTLSVIERVIYLVDQAARVVKSWYRAIRVFEARLQSAVASKQNNIMSAGTLSQIVH